MNGAYLQNMMTKLAEKKTEHVPTYDELERKAWMALILITLVGFTLFFIVENTPWFVTLIIMYTVVISYAFGM